MKLIIRTLYKKVGVKVYLVDDYLLNGIVLEGIINWKPSYEAKI